MGDMGKAVTMIGGGLGMIALWAAFIAGWATHIVWTIKLLTGTGNVTIEQLVFAALGALVPPLGSVHGFMLWFS